MADRRYQDTPAVTADRRHQAGYLPTALPGRTARSPSQYQPPTTRGEAAALQYNVPSRSRRNDVPAQLAKRDTPGGRQTLPPISPFTPGTTSASTRGYEQAQSDSRARNTPGSRQELPTTSSSVLDTTRASTRGYEQGQLDSRARCEPRSLMAEGRSYDEAFQVPVTRFMTANCDVSRESVQGVCRAGLGHEVLASRRQAPERGANRDSEDEDSHNNDSKLHGNRPDSTSYARPSALEPSRGGLSTSRGGTFELFTPSDMSRYQPTPLGHDLPLITATIVSGGMTSARLEALLDSGSSHDCISENAARKCGLFDKGLVKHLPSAHCGDIKALDKVDSCLVVDTAVHLRWQLSGSSSSYDGLFRVVKGLSYDLVICHRTIATHRLWGQELNFHQGNKIDLSVRMNALLFQRQSKEQKEKTDAARRENERKNKAEALARLNATKTSMARETSRSST
ncbi:hypothetical protein LTS10_012430 [Elasticomyces elasticus]|nr:hypothetical protein LTS10_012430 [Elasticomyces elasticus]